MAFLYDVSALSSCDLQLSQCQAQGLQLVVQRQKEMVKMLYNETMALEELLEEAVNTLGPDARDILAQIRYVSHFHSSHCAGAVHIHT